MRLRVIIVGKDKHDPLVAAAEDYRARASRYAPVDLVEIKETPLKKGSVEQVKKDEAARIAKLLDPDEHVVVLDERGKALESTQLAGRLDRYMQDGLRKVAFVIGGPSGLDPDFMARAQERWRLSSLTLPHRLARLLLMEQLYRGFTILRGEPYHK